MSSPLRHLDLFSGIGGFAYAAACVGGYQTTQFVEIDPFCQRVLSHHWPSTPIHSDVRTFTAAPNTYDIITAGFPCQDLSVAGKQLGFNGNRSVLFYEIIRLLRDIQPKFLVLENVANLVSHSNGETFQEVLFQIAKAGFDAEWAVIPASDVGACHRRARIWIVAYPNCGHGESRSLSRSAIHEQANSQGPNGYIGGENEITRDETTSYTENVFSNGGISKQRGQLEGSTFSEFGNSYRADAADTNNKGPQRRQSTIVCKRGTERPTWTRNTPSSLLTPDWRSYVSEPVLCRGDDGLSGRVDRLKALGNAVVPQVAMVPLRRVLAIHDSTVPT